MAPAAVGDLDRDDGKRLLAVARNALEHALSPADRPDSANLLDRVTPALFAQRGAYVSLYVDGHLRGCCGEVEPRDALLVVVAEQAVAAARQDARFTPVEAAELPRTRLEISVLSPSRAVDGPAEIEAGRHGVVLRKSGRSAVLLPQIAARRGWTREQLLTELAGRAGLDPEAWRVGAELRVFEAQVVAEPAD